MGESKRGVEESSFQMDRGVIKPRNAEIGMDAGEVPKAGRTDWGLISSRINFISYDVIRYLVRFRDVFPPIMICIVSHAANAQNNRKGRSN